MHHIVTWVGLRHKSKSRQKPSVPCGTSQSQPKGEPEKKKDVEATGPCHVDLGSGNVNPLNSTSRSNDGDTSACNDDAITGRPASKSSDHSLRPTHDLPSSNPPADLPDPPLNAPTEQKPRSLSRLRRSKSVLGTLSKKLRSRVRAPSAPTPHNSPPARTQLDRRQTFYRPQAVPVVLSDDPVSKERREAALRSRGLLPPRQPRDLSAVEADADRRIDALRKFDSPSTVSDIGHSGANEIAQAWRIRNSEWLSYTLPNSDSPVDPMTQDASPLDAPSHSEGSSEPPTLGADIPASVLLDSPSSISKSLLSGSPAHSLRATSSRGSIGHNNSSLSRAASLGSTGPEGSYLATGTSMRGTSERMTPDLSAPYKTSCVTGPQIAEMPELSALSLRSVSPSPEDLQASSLDQMSFEPHNATVQAKLSLPASSPLYLHTIVSDTFLASPTTPTLSPSVCYSSETEPEDGLVTTENGELDASPVSPTIKNEGGFLCQETILEGSESLSDDDDVDHFHSPPNPPLLTVDCHPTGDDRATAPRRTVLLSRLKSRGSTLAPRPSSALSKSTSMVSLRRRMSGSLFGRTRRSSTVSVLDTAPRSPPRSPLIVKIYDGPTLSAETSGIVDDEVRRLSELAFLT